MEQKKATKKYIACRNCGSQKVIVYIAMQWKPEIQDFICLDEHITSECLSCHKKGSDVWTEHWF